MGYSMFWRDRTHDDVHAAFCRFNSAGMTLVVNAMLGYGMAFHDRTELNPPPGPNATDLEVQRWRSWHGSETPGIPAHKFGTNDGWIVLPVECRAAVEIWQAAGQPEPFDTPDVNQHWHRWIGFLRGASSHDGFEVW